MSWGGTACGCASSHNTLTAHISHITQTFSPTELSHSIFPVPITVVSGHLPGSQGCAAPWLPHAMSMSSHPPAPTALRRFLGTSDVQEVLEEMKEEQRSLSLVQTVSVWQLLQERSVRWQTLSVAVVNVGMQLSGIDAVSPGPGTRLCRDTELCAPAHAASPPRQIWFYTNTIFRNAGIPESQIPYTTVGTGAIEVVAGLIGVSEGWADRPQHPVPLSLGPDRPHIPAVPLCWGAEGLAVKRSGRMG